MLPYTPLTSIPPTSYHLILQYRLQVKIVLRPLEIRQQQQIPLNLTYPLQPGEIHLHSWMLSTSQAPILDLTGEHIKTKEDIEVAFHALNVCP